MKIAACDDNAPDRAALQAVLELYCSTREGVSFTLYSNATDLICRMQEQEYDVLLLDILMPGLSGLAAADEIRRFNEKVEVVFLTSSSEYAVDSYKVRAYYYLMKPVNREELFPVLDRLYEHLRTPEDMLHLKTAQRVLSVPWSRIEAIEVVDKTLFFHLTDGTSTDARLPLSECEARLLSRPEFIKTHRSYVVNLNRMRELSASEFTTLSGRRIPVARGHLKSVREAYVRHLFAVGEEV